MNQNVWDSETNIQINGSVLDEGTRLDDKLKFRPNYLDPNKQVRAWGFTNDIVTMDVVLITWW